jgi:chromate transporter
MVPPGPEAQQLATYIGWLGGWLAPGRFAIGGGHGAAKPQYGPALIDDDTPTPPHARFSAAGLARIVTAGLVLWGGTIGFLCARYGWHGPLTQMGWFFTKAALWALLRWKLGVIPVILGCGAAGWLPAFSRPALAGLGIFL